MDVSGSYAVSVPFLFTNGGTGPTINCRMRVQAATDGSGAGALTVATVFGAYGNSAVAEGSIDLPPGVQFIRTVFDSNTGQAVTVAAVAERVTGV
ncbi:hypothetical protein [Sandarakinorhabdus sp.]|uniref:hypothetical protein n=1 Tax=Sandarakinorhabdus sp. TaxID=1916663 RepID=UPI0035665D51